MANKSSKGGEFERDFSKKFSKYITGGERDDLFWRSSQSGGRATMRAKKGKTTAGSYGDITAIDADYAYITETICFELKKGYNGTNLQDLLDSTKKEPEYIAFWNQCYRDAVLGQRPVCCVVAKRDRKKAVIILPRSFHIKLTVQVGKPLYNRLDINYNGLRLTITPLDDFFENVPASDFISVVQEIHSKRILV